MIYDVYAAARRGIENLASKVLMHNYYKIANLETNLKVSRSAVILSTRSASVRLIFCPSKFMAFSLQ